MLPDLRAVIAATVIVIGLLLAGFGLAATFRVAQQSRPSPLQVARSAVLTEPALRREDLVPALAREEPAPANDEAADETAAIAPNIVPPVETATIAAPSVAAPPAEEPSAPPVVVSVAPDATDTIALLLSDAAVAAAPPAEAVSSPEPVAAVAAPPQPFMPAPVRASEPPVGGPLEQASLNPAETSAATPVVKKKPRLASGKKRAVQKKARAAAKRTAAKRAAANPNPQGPFSQPWTGFTQQQQ